MPVSILPFNLTGVSNVESMRLELILQCGRRLGRIHILRSHIRWQGLARSLLATMLGENVENERSMIEKVERQALAHTASLSMLTCLVKTFLGCFV